MTDRPSAGGTAVRTAIKQLAPWQRVTIFVAGAAAFSIPILDHYANNIIRGVGMKSSLLHVIGDGLFLFMGLLGMVPTLALRIADKGLAWKKK